MNDFEFNKIDDFERIKIIADDWNLPSLKLVTLNQNTMWHEVSNNYGIEAIFSFTINSLKNNLKHMELYLNPNLYSDFINFDLDKINKFIKIN